MSYSDFTEDLVNNKDFDIIYQQIKETLTKGITSSSDKCTIILGGQPGAGKSSFYNMRDDLLNYVPINGDEYRRYHPNYQNIIKTDPEHYAERTQAFSNRIVERLIYELGAEGYNLVIEGTLRNPDVPIKTCELLIQDGYEPDLVVVVCDAETSWKSTLSRARLQKQQGLAPRLVPIDIYNTTVMQIPKSLETIEQKGCFKSITVINRDGEVLYPNNSGEKASEVLSKELNIDNWQKKFPSYEQEFIQEKINILQAQLRTMPIDATVIDSSEKQKTDNPDDDPFLK